MQVIPKLLDQLECNELISWAEEQFWNVGRQGTGYELVSVPRSRFFSILEKLEHKLLESEEEYGDCYIIRYPEGSCIPEHKDDAPMQTEHHRINCLLQAAEQGGVLTVAESTFSLAAGDAYLFRPDLSVHSVSTVTKGTRYLLTMGILREANSVGK